MQLDEALFSIALQSWPNLEIVIALQNGDDKLIADLAELIAAQPWLSNPEFQILSVQVEQGADGRSKLLNHGIRKAKGRYLAFLDYDDVLYQHAYRTLIDRLLQSNSALAAGGCRLAKLNRANNHWFISKKLSPYKWGRIKEDLFIDNFLPIHSYIIDRTRIDDNDLWFDERISLLEDYDFLLRLAVKYNFDMAELDNPICEYRHHEDNSIQVNQYGETIINDRIIKARSEINDRKNLLTVTLPITELNRIRNQNLPNTNINEEKLIELLTKDQRSLNQAVNKIYNLVQAFPRIKSWLVICLRMLRKISISGRSSVGR